MKKHYAWKRYLAILLSVTMIAGGSNLHVLAEEPADAVAESEQADAVEEPAQIATDDTNAEQTDGDENTSDPEQSGDVTDAVGAEQTDEGADISDPEQPAGETSDQQDPAGEFTLDTELTELETSGSADTDPKERKTPPLTYHEIPGVENCDSIYAHLGNAPVSQGYAYALPKTYNPVTNNNYLPPTRDQGQYGTCWAHSTLALGEINMIKNRGMGRNDIDLSELQLSYFMYHSPASDPLGNVVGDTTYLPAASEGFLDAGGNVRLASKIMQGWIGGADETKYPDLAYSNANKNLFLDDNIAFVNDYHMQNSYNINVENRSELKRAIMEYGAVSVSYHDDYEFWDEAGVSYYCPYEWGTNHVVTAVGWDDTYSAEHFNTYGSMPQGDGAWLIRNSWAKEGDVDMFDQCSYFWLSYYDKTLFGIGVAAEYEPADNYDHNYYYDGGASVDWLPVESGTKAANVFTVSGRDADKQERLDAVAFDTESSNVQYTIDIYKFPEGTARSEVTDPEGNGAVKCTTQSGSTSFVGYYTIPLREPVSLKQGDVFSVVVTMSLADDADVNISVESDFDYKWVQGKATCQEHESFWKTPGSDWLDMAEAKKTDPDLEGIGNTRIKAFTVDTDVADTPVTSVSFKGSESTLKIKSGESYVLEAVVEPADASNKRIEWSSSNEDVVTVQYGTITAHDAGEATITAASVTNPEIKVTCDVTVVPGIKIRGAGMDLSDLAYGQDVSLSVEYFPPTLDPSAYTLQWETTTPELATVKEDGTVENVTGAARISVTAKEDPEITDTVTLGVTHLSPVVPDFEIPAEADKILFTWDEVPGAETYSISIYKLDIGLLGEYIYTNVLAPINGIDALTYTLEGETLNELKEKYKQQLYFIVTASGNGLASRERDAIQRSFLIAPTHQITYVLNGGINDPLNPTKYTEGQSLSLRNPKRDYYDFWGWYKDSALTQYFYFTGNEKEDITVYAKWNLTSYYISYNLDGGTNNKGNPYNYTVETETFTLQKPTKKGYIFDGWYEDEEFTKQITEVTKGSHRNLNLYAKWIEENITEDVATKTYGITYSLDGGINSPSNPSRYNALEAAVTLEPAAKTGYTFAGWYTDAAMSKSKKITQIAAGTTGNLILFAKWTPNKYTVLFDGNGAASGKMTKKTFNYGTWYALGANKFKKTGSNFAGWNTKADGTGTAYGNKANVINLAAESGASVTLYAQWREGGYTITYNTKGGVNAAENPEWYDEHSGTITLAAPTMAGNTFEGWFSDSGCRKRVTQIDAGLKKNLVLYAKWRAGVYTIKFDKNGADSGSMADLRNKAYGKKVSLTGNKFRMTNYVFAGWNTEADGTGTHYKNKAKVINLAESGTVTLYAQWTPAPFKITYTLKGGKNNPANPKTYNIETGTITLAAPTKNGWTFDGWYADSKYKNPVTAITGGSTGKKKFYAKWKR